MAKLISEGDFAQDGERAAAALLKQLPDNWLIVANKTIVRNSTRSFEVDFVVVGEQTIFILDEKSWWGQIEGDQSNWLLSSGRVEESPLNKADMVGKVIAGELKKGVPELNQAKKFCRGAVLLSYSDGLPDIKNDPRLYDVVFTRHTLLEQMQRVDLESGDPKIGEMRERIERVLVGLDYRSRIGPYIDAYKVLERIDSRPGCTVLLAEMAGELYTLMLYDLGKDPLEIEANREFLLREHKALRKIRDKKIAPESEAPFRFSDNFLVLPTRTPNLPTLRSLEIRLTLDDFLIELKLARAAFETLSKVHGEGILHRALNPNAVVITEIEPMPKVILTGFYAARLGEESIAARLDETQVGDPYAAPSLQRSYANASQKSDVYSMALIVLERLSGISVGSIVTDAREEALAALTTRWAFGPPQAHAELHRALSTALSESVEAPGIAAWLGRIIDQIGSKEVSTQNTLLDGRYRVIRKLGEGAFAQTLLAEDMLNPGAQFAVKIYRSPAWVLPQVVPEFNLMRNLTSPNLARVHMNFEPDKQVHLVMQYIEGSTLGDLASTFPLPVEKWSQLKDGLLRGIGELEQHNLLHRDIKPRNIIISDLTGDPVLIDFGFASLVSHSAGTAGTPLYQPPEARNSHDTPDTVDRYAVAMVLLEALTGKRASELAEAAATGQSIATGSEEPRVRRLQEILLRSIHPIAALRPKNVAEMRVLFENALTGVGDEEGAILINPWVANVRSLYRFSDVGNANNRGLDTEFVRETYVKTALDTNLYPRLEEAWPLALFLSGNPGDGKTAFLEMVKRDLIGKGGEIDIENASGWEMRLGARTIRACYDASEAFGDLTSDEQLARWLHGLEGADEPSFNGTVLVAINDGRLVDFFERHKGDFQWLAYEVEDARRPKYEGEPDGRAWVVDLKQRSLLARAPNEEQSLFQQVLARLLPPDQWSVCRGCAAHKICPILANAQALQNPEVVDRLERLFLLNHMRHQRHMTMRDLRSALSFLIVGDMGCDKVHKVRLSEDSSIRLVDKHYWNLAFATRREGDDLFADLNAMDPGANPQPVVERILYRMRQAEESEAREAFFATGADVTPLTYSNLREWMVAVKRRAYFEAHDQPIAPGEAAEDRLPERWRERLLPYQFAHDFLDALRNPIRDRMRRLAQIAEAILRSSHIYGTEPPKALTIVAVASEEQRLAVLKEFPLDRFELRGRLTPNFWKLEVEKSVLELVEKGEEYGARLTIGIDLYEFLMRLADGAMAWTEEYIPFLEDLVPFKNRLLLEESIDLVLLENRRRRFMVTQRDGKIVRLAENEGNAR